MGSVATGLILDQRGGEPRDEELRRVPRSALRFRRRPLVQALVLFRFIHLAGPESCLSTNCKRQTTQAKLATATSGNVAFLGLIFKWHAP